MPIWQVSLTDGIYQVADADGVFYPLTMNDVPVSQFNQGWSPRGLQTGVPPFHVLELEHVSGEQTIWLHDETLNYLANAVRGLPADEKALFFDTMEPVVRSLYQECVLAPHASIPAVAHRFDGLLPATVSTLLAEAVNRAIPRPETVRLSALAELEAGYGNGPAALSAGWIEAALSAPPDQAQESFDLPGHRCQRHLDAATGHVFYVLRGKEDVDRYLYVPAANVVFSNAPAALHPLHLLISYYAANTDRVVSLPEALDLEHDVVLPMAPPPHLVEEPVSEAPIQTAPYDEGARTSFEAPLSETSYQPERAATTADIGAAPAAASLATATRDAAPLDAPSRDVRPATERMAPVQPANWWQRLLGLGNN